MLGKWLKRAALVAAGLSVTVGVALYFLQNSIIYLPSIPGFERYPADNPKGYRSPKDRDIPFEETTIVTEDGVKLRSWLLYQEARQSVPTIVFFHENAGNIGYRLDFFELLYRELGVNILAVSYRGYGYSEGTPSESGLQKDARAIMKYAFTAAQIDPTKVILLGRSLGGAVAIYSLWAFTEYPVSSIQATGLILENTFLSIPALVDKLFPRLSFLKWPILHNYWPSESHISSVQCPILFISGDQDELIPPEHMSQLSKLATASRSTSFVFLTQISIAGGDHNTTWRRNTVAYIQAIKDFMQTCLRARA